jgi:hypothetical protein
MTARITVAGTLGLVLTASAQVSNARLVIDFDGSSIVSPINPTATARVWAAWDPGPPIGHDQFLASTRFDFVASEPGLENPVIKLVYTGNAWGEPSRSSSPATSARSTTHTWTRRRTA